VITVHDWETIRLRCGRNKEPIKLVSRETGIAPNTIRKYLRQAEPPARRPRPRARKLRLEIARVYAFYIFQMSSLSCFSTTRRVNTQYGF